MLGYPAIQDSQDEDDQETAAISGGSPYSGATKSGPVSPSPYTANTLRAKAFNVSQHSNITLVYVICSYHCWLCIL